MELLRRSASGNTVDSDDAGGGSESDNSGQLFDGMTWGTRLQFFALFAVLGVFSSVMAWIALGTGSYWKYTMLTTLGNVMSMLSTTFLMGPTRQCALMFDPVRRTATSMYIGAMAGTVIVAWVFRSPLLCGMCSVVQYLALIWYSLSFVPYGRDVVGSCLSTLFKAVLNAK